MFTCPGCYVSPSDNDKGDNGVKSGAMHKSPGVYLKFEENSGKAQLGNRLVKVVRPVSAPNGSLTTCWYVFSRQNNPELSYPEEFLANVHLPRVLHQSVRKCKG